MWELTPRVRNSVKYSLLKPSTLESYTKFQKYAELFPTTRKINYALIVNDSEMMDVETVVVEKEKERKSKPRSASSMTSHFRVTKNNNMLPKNFAEKQGMIIPIQPRKGREVNKNYLID